MTKKNKVDKKIKASRKLDRVLRLISANEQKSLAANRKKHNASGAPFRSQEQKKRIDKEVNGALIIQDRAAKSKAKAWATYRRESGT